MKKNIIANVIGKFWSIVSNFIFVPFYIKYLGLENYSVISFTLIIVGILGIMDAGMTATLAREFAKEGDRQHGKTVLHTLEICYWAIVLLIIGGVFSFAPFIVHHWIHLKKLSPDYVAKAIRLFGVVMAFQLLGNFYIGGFMGLQRQVKANIYQILWGISKNALVVILIAFKPTLIYFFSWQVIVTILYVIALRYHLLKIITHNQFSFFQKVNFERDAFLGIRKFASGMFLIALIAAINMQLDKITISKLLPIDALGIYNLAVTLSMAIVFLVMPISVSLLPKFTSYFTSGKIVEGNKLFNFTFSFVAIIIATTSAILAFHGPFLIYIWTGNHNLANASSSYITYSAIGSAALALQVIPFDVAVSNGNTKINTYMGTFSLLFTIPGYWIGVKFLGPKGAALTWCISQSILTPIFIYFVRKIHLKKLSYSNIMLRKVFMPMSLAFSISYSFSLIIPHFENRLLGMGVIISIGLIILIILLIFFSPVKLRREAFKNLNL